MTHEATADSRIQFCFEKQTKGNRKNFFSKKYKFNGFVYTKLIYLKPFK